MSCFKTVDMMSYKKRVSFSNQAEAIIVSVHIIEMINISTVII